jgi:hypothetical protein
VKTVEIKRRNPQTAEVETLARVWVAEPGGPATFEAADPAHAEGIAALLDTGVPGPGGTVLRPADGAAFVAALPQGLRGSRLWAADTGGDT